MCMPVRGAWSPSSAPVRALGHLPPSGGKAKRRAESPRPTDSRRNCPGISEAWHRRRPGGPSRYSAAAVRACRVIPMRAARGAASSAQATDRSLPGRPESSFPPLGLLSPPNPLRWASAGAPVTASASQWGGRRCRPGSFQPITAHRRHGLRIQGPQALVVFPPLLTPKAVRPPRRRPRGAPPAGGWRAEVVAPHVVDTSYGSLASPQAAKLVPSTVPPLPTTTTPLGRRGGPIRRADGIRPYGPGSCHTAPAGGASRMPRPTCRRRWRRPFGS